MKILNFGSLNIDYVYNVDHIVMPGETIGSYTMNVYPGGKGLNQTLAIARAGADVYHAGMVGQDGRMLTDLLQNDHVHCDFIRTVSHRTGSAFIQVDKNGQNSIVLNGGANNQNTLTFIESVLNCFDEGDWVLLQNEINLVDEIIQRAYDKKMRIAFNPSPINDALLDYALDKISLFIMNEHEGEQITGEKETDTILAAMHERYPKSRVVLTLGKSGAVYRDNDNIYKHEAFSVEAVDTTAAGDTFTGYFLAAMTRNEDVPSALHIASKAAALAVTKKGAASSIPYLKEVIDVNLPG